MSEESAGQQQQNNVADQSNQPQRIDPPEWYTKPPAWLTQPPQQQPTQPPAQQPQGGRGYGQDILTALQGLPEQIVNAMKETAPQQPTPPQQSKPAESGEQSKPAEPGKKTFAERWFGG